MFSCSREQQGHYGSVHDIWTEDETEPKYTKFRDINFAGKFEHYWV